MNLIFDEKVKQRISVDVERCKSFRLKIISNLLLSAIQHLFHGLQKPKLLL